MKQLLLLLTLILLLPANVVLSRGQDSVRSETTTTKSIDPLFESTTSSGSTTTTDPSCKFLDNGTVACKNNLIASPCEIVSRALLYLEKKGEIPKENYQSFARYTCSEFVDPIPARFFGSSWRGDNYCVTLAQGEEEYTNAYGYQPNAKEDQYCVAMLQPSGDINIIFGFVVFIYDLALPFLVTAAVLALVVTGVLMMYSGASEDATKKSKEMIIRIAAGLALLFSIKIILTTVDSTFFRIEPEDTSTSTLDAGGAITSPAEVEFPSDTSGDSTTTGTSPGPTIYRDETTTRADNASNK